MEMQETSLEAYHKGETSGLNSSHRAIILDRFYRWDAMTCDEIEIKTDMIHQTASSCIRALVKEGFLIDTGVKRPTRTGRSAIVWDLATKKNEQFKFI